ncbi:hypothetical protein ACF07Y_39300 [Streptomyces sp. NPDC016566]|uniref:hypothetical protein n=1 Tax=Streptomyces sp. NPDC016566 TaxID=3364967 RepID=UPI0036FE4F75
MTLSIASTAPDAAGHNGGIETTASRSGNEWAITGSKIHIENVHLAGVHSDGPGPGGGEKAAGPPDGVYAARGP